MSEKKEPPRTPKAVWVEDAACKVVRAYHAWLEDRSLFGPALHGLALEISILEALLTEPTEESRG